MRKFTVAANWKMNKSPTEADLFFQKFKTAGSFASRIVFFVPAIDLMVAREHCLKTKFGWGAQNIYFEMSGAFTGELSPKVLAEVGATDALVGHSERRALFGETDEMTAKKVKALQAVGLSPMLCVGETLAERESGKTDSVIVRQLKTGLKDLDPARPITVAYEPVWAIGTGKVATPEQAGLAHTTLRKALVELGGNILADSTSILYGGSVKPQNAADIAKQSDVDGFLVGGASLEVDSFKELCQFSK